MLYKCPEGPWNSNTHPFCQHTHSMLKYLYDIFNSQINIVIICSYTIYTQLRICISYIATWASISTFRTVSRNTEIFENIENSKVIRALCADFQYLTQI